VKVDAEEKVEKRVEKECQLRHENFHFVECDIYVEIF